MAFTLDSKIGDFLSDPKGLAVFAQLIQELQENPVVDMAKGMSLKDILDIPQVKKFGITEDLVKTGLAHINARLK